MKLEVELDQCSPRYGYVHKAGCRDLSDSMPVGETDLLTMADELVAGVTGWEPPYSYATCTAALR